MPQEAYQHKLDVLGEHCRVVGRDPNDIRKQLVVQAVVSESERELEERIEQVANARGQDAERLRSMALIGTPEQCVERLLPYVEMGVGDFLIGARAPADLETLELIAKKVAPALREQAKPLLAAG